MSAATTRDESDPPAGGQPLRKMVGVFRNRVYERGIDLALESGSKRNMRIPFAFTTVLAIGLATAGPIRGVEPQPSDEQIVPESRLARDVVVRDVSVDDDGTVAGTVVNNSGKLLRDVRLMIRRSWLWKDEFHPGKDDPSRTEYFTLQQDIPPGGQAC